MCPALVVLQDSHWHGVQGGSKPAQDVSATFGNYTNEVGMSDLDMDEDLMLDNATMADSMVCDRWLVDKSGGAGRRGAMSPRGSTDGKGVELLPSH
jgi:hypothetical protein